ncbi:MAG: cytochrome c-type biogenesis protein CcmH [Proteobacteria bacterium]|jgi:cytochrome c-type biogenesis protein CcmH|nr:cytochrome c-type biogenesis protein CcmH [Pseudomonadota bacterium]MDB4827271.1 cytochrome c-type biogenesis protein CcmH [Gammaproteobacteria bacterium]MBT4108127.1 cytochrome c-type biogenesis protein CcmH [Pseudomonadota bacterium]MBT4988060.1 cytochrome c-type biogenesis protein CcmH [Pseudomonadota bacterium]MBT5188675.1 cytochrome c-type biogenesis protein CcmH [Pseudomonadota bacterium]
MHKLAERFLEALKILLVVGVFTSSTMSFAAIETYQFSDTEDEIRYQKMIAELRCLVCQNQNLADSNAELAQDLRAKTFEMVNAGASNNEIAEFMVARYGDFVLYRPPLKGQTLLLWIGPFGILLIALIVFFITVRRSQTNIKLSTQARARAASLLDEGH